MSPSHKLTSAFVREQIEIILDNNCLPGETTTAPEIITRLATSYAGWKKDNPAFVQENPTQISECDNTLREIIKRYQEVQKALKRRNVSTASYRVTGHIREVQQMTSWHWGQLHGRLDNLITHAKKHTERAAPAKKD